MTNTPTSQKTTLPVQDIQFPFYVNTIEQALKKGLL